MYVGNIVGFYLIVGSLWANDKRLLAPLGIIYGLYTIILGALSVYYVICTKFDPTDKLYYLDKASGFKLEDLDPEAPENENC